MVRRLIALSAALAALACMGAPALAAGVTLATYRAVYDLVLDKTDDSTDLADLNGRIVMEFTGSACGGYSVALRFVTDIADPEGARRITDARTTTFEAGDGEGFRFTNETFVDEALTEESKGEASRTDNGVDVALTKPGTQKFLLDDEVVFPTEQIEKIIAAAHRGESFFQMEVYDGSEDGETVYSTAVVVGKGSNAAHDVGDETAANEAGVAGLWHWPVTVSYFDGEGDGEQTPIYVMSFVLYENGVSRHLKIDYGDFAIVWRLSDLDMIPAKDCPLGPKK